MSRIICSNCHKELEDTNFYTYKNGQKCDMCKSCLTMHVDNFDESTYLWILQKMDVPYVPVEWQVLRSKAYAKNPKKINGMSVLGKYLAKMRLKQWIQYSWADSEMLQQKYQQQLEQRAEENRMVAEQARKQYEQGLISEAQYRTLTSTEFQMEYDNAAVEDPIGTDNMFNENNFLSEQEMPDLDSNLTLEDKQYLAMKWGRTYKPSQWLELEKKYTEMMNSFDIQDADSKNTLIFICKTYLKMNQAIDIGDVEGYQKLSRVYDTLRKSAKFTAAQNKEEKSDFIDSVGQLVAYCQKYGGKIPKYNIETPYDIIDKIIQDLKQYNKTLIEEDTALGREIQDYIKQARAAIENRKDREEAKAKGLDTPEISDQDIVDFKDFIQKEKKDDEGDEE